ERTIVEADAHFGSRTGHAAGRIGAGDKDTELVRPRLQHARLKRVFAPRAVTETVRHETAIEPGGVDFVDAAEHEGGALAGLRSGQREAGAEPQVAGEGREARIRIAAPVREPRRLPVRVAIQHTALPHRPMSEASSHHADQSAAKAISALRASAR